MWGPSMREGSRLSWVKGKLYLFGGIGWEMAGGVNEYSADTGEWNELECKGECPPTGRIGHS